MHIYLMQKKWTAFLWLHTLLIYEGNLYILDRKSFFHALFSPKTFCNRLSNLALKRQKSPLTNLEVIPKIKVNNGPLLLDLLLSMCPLKTSHETFHTRIGC